MKILHLADLHFSVKPEKLEEVVRTSDYALECARQDPPDLITLAGDTLDEHDGPIRIDSDCARAAIRFVLACADIAPVAIVLGTPSHDRKSPELFRFLKGKFPIYVASQIEMVALNVDPFGGFEFSPNLGGVNRPPVAVLTFLPSPDKARVIGTFGGDSKQLTTLAAKDALHDALAYIGELNAQVPVGVPRILVAHGMISGSEYSTGAVSTGEDFEFALHDINLTNTDAKMFGHVHKFQCFPGHICYAGSPGRLNFGETEEKGFLVWEIEDRQPTITFVPTPARSFLFAEVPWEGIDHLQAEIARVAGECAGKDTRFRYTVPEEERHLVTRDQIERQLLDAGARLVKVEYTVIPAIRQRAAGISKKETLVDKILAWGAATGIEIPGRVLEIAATIEGDSAEELIALVRHMLDRSHEEPAKKAA